MTTATPSGEPSRIEVEQTPVWVFQVEVSVNEIRPIDVSHIESMIGRWLSLDWDLASAINIAWQCHIEQTFYLS